MTTTDAKLDAILAELGEIRDGIARLEAAAHAGELGAEHRYKILKVGLEQAQTCLTRLQSELRGHRPSSGTMQAVRPPEKP